MATYRRRDHADDAEHVYDEATSETHDGVTVEREHVVERETPALYEERVASTAYEESVVEDRVGYFDSVPARVNSVLFALLLALEGLLTLRFALVAFGASRTSGFVEFVMDVSWPFVRPFSNAFANRTWDEGIIEVNTLLAMGVWALFFLLLALLVNAVLPNFDERGSRFSRRRVTHS